MKRAHFCRSDLPIAIFIFVTLGLIVGVTTLSVAEMKSLKLEISDYVSNADARQIRRLLAPWADAKDISFHTPVDKKGRKRLFATVVEVKPRRGVSKYSETHAFDVYDIMRQLKDSRFRGRHGLGQIRILKTEATIQGNIFTYPAISRSHVNEVPGWALWARGTSQLLHALQADGDGQKFVFTASPEFDRLRIDIAKSNNKKVEVKGRIVGFDGPYPIVSVTSYKLAPRVNRMGAPAQEQPRLPNEKRDTEQKPKYDYIEEDR